MWLNEQIKQASNNGVNIFLDVTNLTPQQRKSHLKRMPKGYSPKAIVFEKPNNKVWEKALNSRGDKTIPKKVLIEMEKSYIEPKAGEGFDTIIKVPAFF